MSEATTRAEIRDARLTDVTADVPALAGTVVHRPRDGWLSLSPGRARPAACTPGDASADAVDEAIAEANAAQADRPWTEVPPRAAPWREVSGAVALARGAVLCRDAACFESWRPQEVTQ